MPNVLDDPNTLLAHQGVQDPRTGKRYYGDPWESPPAYMKPLIRQWQAAIRANPNTTVGQYTVATQRGVVDLRTGQRTRSYGDPWERRGGSSGGNARRGATKGQAAAAPAAQQAAAPAAQQAAAPAGGNAASGAGWGSLGQGAPATSPAPVRTQWQGLPAAGSAPANTQWQGMPQVTAPPTAQQAAPSPAAPLSSYAAIASAPAPVNVQRGETPPPVYGDAHPNEAPLYEADPWGYDVGLAGRDLHKVTPAEIMTALTFAPVVGGLGRAAMGARAAAGAAARAPSISPEIYRAAMQADTAVPSWLARYGMPGTQAGAIPRLPYRPMPPAMGAAPAAPAPALGQGGALMPAGGSSAGVIPQFPLPGGGATAYGITGTLLPGGRVVGGFRP